MVIVDEARRDRQECLSHEDARIRRGGFPRHWEVNFNEYIYDWNTVDGSEIPRGRPVMLADETLRDGLQNPSVKNPAIGDKLKILHLMEDLGIESLDIGLPGAGPRAREDTLVLAREIVQCRMKIRPYAAARTHEDDIRPVAEISQKAGMAVEVAMFLGSSPIRRLAEDWTVDHLVALTERAVDFAVRESLPVMYVTEDTIRTDPATVKRLYSTAIARGAQAIVLCDTVGHATPRGAYNLMRFAVEELVKPAGRPVRLDWHGHNDRGLAVANSMGAIMGGADQVHGAAISLGERVGNTAIELMLVNLKLMGVIDRDLSRLKEYCELVARATGVSIPPNYPVFGRDAFRTATGVHAAAIVKAYKKNDDLLANSVYSGVPSHFFGLEQVIDIGPMSGRSNVTYWLEKRGLKVTDAVVERILAAAKQADGVLSEAEVRALVDG